MIPLEGWVDKTQRMWVIKYVQMLDTERKHQTQLSLSSSGESTKAEEAHEGGCENVEEAKNLSGREKTKKEIMMSKNYTT